MGKLNLLSLDIETSSNDLSGELISIACVKVEPYEDAAAVLEPDPSHWFYAQARFEEGLFCKPESMLINGITFQELNNKKNPTLEELDRKLCYWLGTGKYVAMGRGIGYFDMMFIERDLPCFFARLSRRVFDLSGWVYGEAARTGIDAHKLRENAMGQATDRMPKFFANYGEIKRHHALWDAWHNILFYLYLKNGGLS